MAASCTHSELPTSYLTSNTSSTQPQQSCATAPPGTTSADLIIIGAGPAGLAMAGALKQLHPHISCILLECAEHVGDTWHKHYDRLHLHSSKAVSFLPFLPFPEDAPQYPSKRQVAEYLESYANHFQLDVRLQHRVTAVTPPAPEDCEGRFQITASCSQGRESDPRDLEFHASNVVIATGQNSIPMEPQLPGRSSFKGIVMHSAHYKNPEPFKNKNVLVVGFGNSAGEIALDLSEKGAKPTVLIRSEKVVIIPRGAFAPGFSTLASMDYKRTLRPWKALLEVLYGPLCTMGIPNMRPYGVPQVTPFWGGNPGVWDPNPPLIDIGQCASIVRGDIKVLRGSLEGFTEAGVLLAPSGAMVGVQGVGKPDLTEVPFDAVILCTGYRECFSQLLPPALLTSLMDQARSGPAVSGDVTAVPGLFFIGWDNLLSLLAMIRQEAIHLSGLVATRLARKRTGIAET